VTVRFWPMLLKNSSCGLSLLPIIGDCSGNQHNAIIQLMRTKTEFFNGIGQ
jgi:hypothetical protein